MSKQNTGGPAFPLHNHGVQTLGMHIAGMTLRDYFAAKAMDALLNQPDRVAQAFKSLGLKESEVANHIAMGAYHFADAMLKAREA